jgi:hypothetical protein
VFSVFIYFDNDDRHKVNFLPARPKQECEHLPIQIEKTVDSKDRQRLGLTGLRLCRKIMSESLKGLFHRRVLSCSCFNETVVGHMRVRMGQ